MEQIVPNGLIIRFRFPISDWKFYNDQAQNCHERLPPFGIIRGLFWTSLESQNITAILHQWFRGASSKSPSFCREATASETTDEKCSSPNLKPSHQNWNFFICCIFESFGRMEFPISCCKLSLYRNLSRVRPFFIEILQYNYWIT